MGMGIGHPGTGRPGVGPAALVQVRNYWQGLRRQSGRNLPRRADIDPRGLEGALTCAFIAERIAPGMARFRLAGMHLADLMGMDVRGMPVSSLFELDARPRLAEVLGKVFTMPGIAELWISSPQGLGRQPLSGRMLLLPIEGEGEAPLVLGCLAAEGSIGRSPRRLMIDRVATEALDLVPAGTSRRPRLTEFAEPAAQFVPPPRAKPGRAHLRLVKSD